MARIRTIKPEFWTDEKIGECSPSARLLFVASWNFADDHGGLNRSAKQLKAQAFPYDNVDCEPLILELIEHGLLIEYQVCGQNYLHIKGFHTHQKIDKPAKPRIPVYDGSANDSRGLAEDSTSSRRGLGEDSRRKGREGKGKEGSRMEGKGEDGAREPEFRADNGRPISEATRACMLLRESGFMVANSGHPALLATLSAGVTPEALVGVAREFRDKGLAYWCSTAVGRIRDQAAMPAIRPGPKALTIEQMEELDRARGLLA